MTTIVEGGSLAIRSGPSTERAPRENRGMLRVPFVRRCTLTFDDGRTTSAFTVNINVIGAYLAVDHDQMPHLGAGVTCRFLAPGKATELTLAGTVTWINPAQQHPVHSLPPGIGVKLAPLSPDDRRCIEDVVDDYVARNPQAAR
jgi:Tfp pilus assembly protein PilZ